MKLEMIVSDVELFTFNESHPFAPTDKMNNATARSVVAGIREIWNFEFDGAVSSAVQETTALTGSLIRTLSGWTAFTYKRSGMRPVTT